MTDAVVGKLEEGFLRGMNDTECCLYAGISRDTLHEYCKKNPEFSDKKEALKSRPSLKAKMNITDAIENGDIEISKWYLERRNKSEFSLKHELEGRLETVKLEDIL